MSKSTELGIQSESKPLLDYSSHSTSHCQPQQVTKNFTNLKCGALVLLAGIATGLMLVAAIVALTVVISQTMQHNSSNAASQVANSANATMGTVESELTAEQRQMLELHADWRNVYTPETAGEARLKSGNELDSRANKAVGALPSLNYEGGSFELGAETSVGRGRTVSLTTKFGKVLGVQMQSRQGRTYFAFLKVPYAAAPTGERRFRAPQAVDRWSGTLDATKLPPECIQKVKYSDFDEAGGEEDCLYMSIYTPKLPSKRIIRRGQLPVMFYIHGGGFTDGNGTRYGAEYFMDEDVVLITFQYRLGFFGFLNTNDGDVTGNIGMKDQVEALRFVQKIIADFNGDAKRVTIFGNSAGGMSVSFHMLSPLSSGLFSRAIAQSGTSMMPFDYAIDKHPEKSAMILAKKFNCSYGNGYGKQKLSDCLRNVSAADIALVRSIQTKFAVSIEEATDGAFLSDYPLNLYRAGKLNKVPFVAGVNSAEGLPQALIFLSVAPITYLLNKNWAAAAPILFQLNSSAFDKDAISYRVRDFFFGNKDVSNETLWNLTALATDRMMIHATKVQATYQAEVSPVYLYYLTKRPAKSYGDKSLKGWPPGDYGVAHADELQYLFPYDGYPQINTTSPYFRFSADLVKTWATFGATGKPDGGWLAFEAKKQELWYKLDEQRSMTDVLVQRMKLWDSYSAHDLSYE